MSIEHIEVNGHELTAFDLPPETSETYKVHVDGLGEIVVENGKPPKEKDVPAMYMRKLVPELCEQNAELHRENAKLREYAKAYLASFRFSCEPCPYCAPDSCEPETFPLRDGCRLYEEMRELGIEVES